MRTPGRRELRAKFMKLAKIEPQLLWLLKSVESIRKESKGKLITCANLHWYGSWGSEGLRGSMCQLVGWGAKKSGIKDCESYAIASTYLYEGLPYCRNCGCLGVEQNEDEIAQARADEEGYVL